MSKVKPYKVFRFRDYPVRWVVAWVLWNVGEWLENRAAGRQSR